MVCREQFNGGAGDTEGKRSQDEIRNCGCRKGSCRTGAEASGCAGLRRNQGSIKPGAIGGLGIHNGDQAGGGVGHEKAEPVGGIQIGGRLDGVRLSGSDLQKELKLAVGKPLGGAQAGEIGGWHDEIDG